MPVNLHTTFGKVPYEVSENFKLLSAAVGQLEDKIGALGSTGGVAQIREELRRLSARVDTLTREVQALQQAP